MHDDDNQITFISPRINGVQFGASFVPEQGNADASSPNSAARAANASRDNGYGLAANYETAISDMSLKVSVGYSDAGSDDSTSSTGDHTATQGAIQLGFGGFTVSAGYGEEQKDDATAIDSNAIVTSLAYNAGPAGLSILYVRGEDDSVDTKQDIIEFGANYAIGPGVTAKGSIYVWDKDVSSTKTAEGIAVAGGLVLSF
jgi:predicted porin